MTAPPPPPPGWYPNPSGQGQRYWDGEHWAPEEPVVGSAPKATGLSKGAKAAIFVGGAAVLLVVIGLTGMIGESRGSQAVVHLDHGIADQREIRG